MAVAQKVKLPLDQRGIMEILPHRPPFLWVDKITELEPGQSAKGTFFADPACDFFAGHFPGNPVMPGVLILEVMNQIGAVALLASPEYKGMIPVFREVHAEIKRPVKPGDTLVAEVKKAWYRMGCGEFEGVARVGDEVVALSTAKFVLVDSL